MRYPALMLVLCTLTLPLFAQEEDLMDMLDSQQTESDAYVYATFKGTRLINLPTVEVEGKGTLEFRIAHRFADMSEPANNLAGLDGPVALYLTLDYSLSNRLSVGIGRTNNQRLLDGNVKYQILKQKENDKMPLTLTYLGKLNVTHLPTGYLYKEFTNRLSYVNQLLLARKFNRNLSLQLGLVHVHRNLVQTRDHQNTLFAATASGRYKLTRRVAITAEYGTAFHSTSSPESRFFDHLGVGVEIETGGHVFQLFLLNSYTVNEAQFLPSNDRAWSDKAFRFGFNVSRVFTP